MKITEQHLEILRNAIEPIDTEDRRTAYRHAGLSFTLYAWDTLQSAGLRPFVCSDLYEYLNDSHIDTALRAIIKGY